jgi:hypothetical protein
MIQDGPPTQPSSPAIEIENKDFELNEPKFETGCSRIRAVLTYLAQLNAYKVRM